MAAAARQDSAEQSGSEAGWEMVKDSQSWGRPQGTRQHWKWEVGAAEGPVGAGGRSPPMWTAATQSFVSMGLMPAHLTQQASL